MVKVRRKIIKALQAATGEKEIHLETPEIEEYGDYSSNIALVMFSNFQFPTSDFQFKPKTPKELAEEIKKRLSKDKELAKYVSKIEVAGKGFINFWLTKSYLVSNLGDIIKKKEKYGSSDLLKGKKILLEHTSPNTIKTLHVGHVRNNVLGMAVHNILEFAGANVTLDAINNDRGIHVMKAVWAYLKFGEGQTPQSQKKKSDQFVDEYYIKGARAYEDDQAVKEEIRALLRDWEAGDSQLLKTWKILRDWTLAGFKETYRRLGSHHDHQWYESDYYQKGKEIVEEGLKKKVFKKLPDGAVLTNLEKYNLPDTIILRSDGTSMYHTQDLYLTKLKREKFPSDLYIWDVGPEQTLYLAQLFSMCEQLGFGKKEDYFHLAYGFVYLRGKGKMSSRAGTVISADWLMDEMVQKARKIVKDSETGKDFSQKEMAEISKDVGLAAIKYGFLKLTCNSDLYFDIDESLSLQGNSGPYLQDTFARTQSVLAKAQSSKRKIQNYNNIEFNTEEISLLRTFVKFQEMIEEAAKNYEPNLVCNYLYDLAQKYNTFYAKHRILGEKSGRVKEQESRSEFRLALTKATGQILANGLTLLGIKTPARM